MSNRISPVRIRQKADGVLQVHDLMRNFHYEIYPFERNRVNEEGVSTVILSMTRRFEEKEVFKILKRLQSLDKESGVKWNVTYNYLSAYYAA